MGEKKTSPKGGTRFPVYNLSKLIQYISKLSSNTHNKTITLDQLNAGVLV